MRTTILIPTYNEKGNIRGIVESVRKEFPEGHIMVIDDNSPDGTGEVVREIAARDTQVTLLARKGKEGLGKAYLDAMRRVLTAGETDRIITMDADFSHDPKYLKEMVRLSSTDHTVVIGSRYCKGGSMVGWELWRVLLSAYGNFYARTVTRMPIYDMTAGFICIPTKLLKTVDLDLVAASGYAFLMELKYTLWLHGAQFTELPICFKNRVEGESKITGHIVSEGLAIPWRLRARKKILSTQIHA